MKTGRIKIINFERQFDGNYGVMYVYFVEMDNGDWGNIQIKTKDKYKSGDEISYDLEPYTFQGSQLWKLKIKTPTASFGGNKVADPQREQSIIRQSCLKVAAELCVGGKINVEQLLLSADKFVDWVNKK